MRNYIWKERNCEKNDKKNKVTNITQTHTPTQITNMI